MKKCVKERKGDREGRVVGGKTGRRERECFGMIRVITEYKSVINLLVHVSNATNFNFKDFSKTEPNPSWVL